MVIVDFIYISLDSKFASSMPFCLQVGSEITMTTTTFEGHTLQNIWDMSR